MRPRGSEKSFSFNAMPRPSLTGRFGKRGGAAVCEVEDPVRADTYERKISVNLRGHLVHRMIG